MKNIVISKHTFFLNQNHSIFTTGSSIEDFFQKNNINYICIKHPLNNVPSSLGDDFRKKKAQHSVKIYPSSLIETFSNGRLTKEIIVYNNSSLLPIKTIQEFFITLKVLNTINKQIDLFIAINPLNALYGIVLKKIGKVKKIIFYTADYAEKRFNNPVINWIYHTVDQLAVRYSDQIWNVSTRITDLRKRQGLKAKNNIFVPNSPPFNKKTIFNIDRINKYEIVIAGVIEATIDFTLIFKVISILKNKYPSIKLKIIGGDDWKTKYLNLIEKLDISRNVKFIGKLNHIDFLNELSKSSIGIAFYPNEIPWNYYCDSMKIRDYLSCGLPVITNNTHSIADDIKINNAGLVIELGEKQLKNALDIIFSDENLYQKMRNNAIDIAKIYDNDKLLNKLLADYIQK